MSLQEKMAVFITVVCFITIITYLILMSIMGPYSAMRAFGILGILGITPFIYRKFSKKGRTLLDERDVSIRKKAASIAFRLFWILFVFSSLFLYYLYQDSGVITIHVFPLLIFIGVMIISVTWSVSILILYHRD
jgi:hypothetical protein